MATTHLRLTIRKHKMLPNQKLQHGLAHCPTCDTALIAPFTAAGSKARCTRCGDRFQIPQVSDLFEEAVAYLIERDESGHEYDDFEVDYNPYAPASTVS